MTFVGIPHIIYAACAIGFNFWANINWNDWWAEGNVFLVGNTIFLLSQAIGATPLLFESPMLLRRMKIFRVFMLGSALIYNFFYIGAFGEVLFSLFVEDPAEIDDRGIFDLIIQLIFGYSTIIHAPIVPINLAIIFKEFWLQFYQMISDVNDTSEDRVQLGMIEFSQGGQALLNIFNPWYWFTYVFEEIFHFPISDFFIYNNNDKQHYYKNVFGW